MHLDGNKISERKKKAKTKTIPQHPMTLASSDERQKIRLEMKSVPRHNASLQNAEGQSSLHSP